MDETEKQPLLASRTPGPRLGVSKRVSIISERDVSSLDLPQGAFYFTASGIAVQKHLTLSKAIAIMVGSVAGSAIFVAPAGVLKGAGSVGASMIIWAVCGALNLLLALCYAELGSAIPVAGGDYAYIYKVLGRFPAFMCLWVMVVLIGPVALAFISRTFGMYFATLFSLECQPTLIVFCAILVVVAGCMLNVFSLSWASRSAAVLSLAKVGGLSIIILMGIIKLAEGHTSNFHNMFEGTATRPGNIILAFLPGFLTYGGWDCINALAEEMKNPRRDMPIAALVSLVLVTVIYLLVNASYFTVLSPEQFLKSDAVAMSFMQRALPSCSWVIPVLVCLSTLGTVVNTLMSCPRWAFAGGRDGNLPRLFSFMHIRHFTPVPAVVFTCVLGLFFTVTTFLDLQGLISVVSLQIQIKTCLALVALIYLKYKMPETPRTIQIPMIMVIFALLMLLILVGVAVYEDPIINGASFLIFLLGAPIYLFTQWLQRFTVVHSIMDSLTSVIQRFMLVVPEKRKF